MATAHATQTTAAAAAAAAQSTLSISHYDTGLDGVNQVLNMTFKDMLWWGIGIVGFTILAIRFIELGWRHLRHVSSMSRPASEQIYWSSAQWRRMQWIKKNLIYAPIWRKRHNREIRISSALSIGTLPTRFQAVFLVCYIASNIAYMCILDYAHGTRWSLLAELRGRSGTLAAVNLMPLIVLAARNNPAISVLRISFDTYNLLHRWIGRTIVAEAIIHTLAWLFVQVSDGGWVSVVHKMGHDTFITSGTVGTCAMVTLAIAASSPLRHAFYETFLAMHLLLAVVAVVCIWVHCVTSSIPGGLPQLAWVVGVVLLWMAERLTRVGLNAYRSWSRHGWPDASVEPLGGEVCRVTLHLPRFVDVKPGSHAYLRFLDISPLQCHPFSIAWVEHKPKRSELLNARGVLPVAEKEGHTYPKGTLTGFNAARQGHLLRTSVSFVIGAQTGFTRKLYNSARQSGKPCVTFKALMEGPYAGHHSLDSYGHAVLIAGATGITHQLSYLRPLLEGYAENTVATRRVTLIWIIRDYEAIEWVRPWMNKIMQLPGRPDVLRIRLFITRPKVNMQQHQQAINSRSIRLLPGRPNIPVILREEVSEQIGAMCVTVCGPGALADDVRFAVRDVQDEDKVVDFIEESFTW